MTWFLIVLRTVGPSRCHVHPKTDAPMRALVEEAAIAIGATLQHHLPVHHHLPPFGKWHGQALSPPAQGFLDCPRQMQARGQQLALCSLGIQPTFKDNLNNNPAEFNYGTTLRLSGDYLSTPITPGPSPSDYIRNLHDIFKHLWPSSPRTPSDRTIFASRYLESNSHVFVCRGAIRPPLAAPYDGPFSVLSLERTFTVDARASMTSSAKTDSNRRTSPRPLLPHFFLVKTIL